MYSDDSNNDVLQKGRKKVYSAKEKLELTLPNGDVDGVLEEGDLVYIVQRYKVNDADAFRFMVMKFADSKKQSSIYSADKKHFTPHFDKKSNVEGDVKAVSDEPKDEKVNYIVPAITGFSAGAFSYLLAKKHGKNPIYFGIGGLVLGIAVGVFILKSKKEVVKKDSSKTDTTKK